MKARWWVAWSLVGTSVFLQGAAMKMDGGRPGDRVVELDSVKNPHLDHGYAVTSHSSQGRPPTVC